VTTAVDDGRDTEQGRQDDGLHVAQVVLDLMLGLACLYVGWLIAVSAVESANNRAQVGILTREARLLYDAFERYYERNHGYPASYAHPRFDLRTADPLAHRGYYRGPIQHTLANHRFDAYDSPDDRGPNREFWLEMTLANDPSIRLLLAKSDDAPLGGGKWREGIFIFRDGILEPL
jgi:hypothetical protein